MRPKKEEPASTQAGASPKRTNCRLRLLPRYLFSGSLKLILQADSLGGSSLGDYPLLQESALLWEISFSFTCSLNRTSFRNFPAHSRTETNSWLVIGRRDYLFFLLIFLSEKLARSIEDSAWKDCNRRYSYSKRNYLLSKVLSKING